MVLVVAGEQIMDFGDMVTVVFLIIVGIVAAVLGATIVQAKEDMDGAHK